MGVHLPARNRFGLLALFAFSFAGVTNSSPAQVYRPGAPGQNMSNPQVPNPNNFVPNPNARAPQQQFAQSGPMFETVWTCESCGKEVGKGSAPPTVSKCPHCGVKIGYTKGPDGVKHYSDSSDSSSSSNRGLVKLVVFGAMLVIGAIVAVFKSVRSKSKSSYAKRERRPTRERDRDLDRPTRERDRDRDRDRDERDEDRESDRPRRKARRDDKDDEPFDFSRIR